MIMTPIEAHLINHHSEVLTVVVKMHIKVEGDIAGMAYFCKGLDVTVQTILKRFNVVLYKFRERNRDVVICPRILPIMVDNWPMTFKNLHFDGIWELERIARQWRFNFVFITGH